MTDLERYGNTMRPIKIRYTWRRKEDGYIWQEIAPIECVEGRGDTPFVLQDHSLWEIIGRDLFTGLVDKNGKEIYEGDIIHEGDQMGVVKYAHCGFFVYGVVIWKPCPLCEVVGNIYENPDLLQGEWS